MADVGELASLEALRRKELRSFLNLIFEDWFLVSRFDPERNQ